MKVRVAYFLAILVMTLWSCFSSPAAAQTPSSGTVSRPSQTTASWCGGLACGSTGNQTSVTNNPLASDCTNSKCETFALTVGSANAGDVVSISINWVNSANDYDLFVYDSNGTLVAASTRGAPGTSEQATILAVAGTYAVKVLFYTVVSDNYVGTATLQAGPISAPASYVDGTNTIHFSPNVTVKAPVAARDGEPSDRVDFQGNAYVSGIRGVPAGVDLWYFNLASSSPRFDPQLRNPFYRGQPDSFPESQALDVGADGGGDVDLAVGFTLPFNPSSAANVPNLTVVSLVAANISSARSQDLGVTFMKNPAASIIPADDRQWLEALGGDTEFLFYRAPIPFTQLFVQTSTDGGFSYAGQSVVSTGGTTPGYIAVDQNRNSAGKNYVYAANSNSSAMFVSRAEFDPANPLTPMVFRRFTVDNTTSHRHLFDVAKVAQDGTVYACWSNDTNIYLSHSTDHGITWSPKVQVNNPNFTVTDRLGNLQTVKTNLFPWCAAGNSTQVDIVWYGTTAISNNDNADWNVFFAQTLDATSNTPTFTQVKASDHFIHAGNISEGGLTGTANRNLLDYFQVALDPQGAAFISYTDDHNDFTGHTYVTRQLDGSSAFGGNVPAVASTAVPAQAPNAPQVTDFSHDAVAGLLAVIATDNPLDILSIRYGCETTADNRTLVAATMKVSDLSVIPTASNWRMNFTANALAGLSDRGDQFFVRASTDTVTPTFTYGTTVRNSDGSLTNTTRGSADGGFFDTANKAITLKVDINKLNPFVTMGNPQVGSGTTFIGLRGSTFTTTVGTNAIRDITRGGSVPIGQQLQGDTTGGIGNTQFTIANCSTNIPPPPPPPPPPGTQKNISISGGGSIGANGSDDNFGFNADNRPAGHLLYQDKAAGIDLVSTSVAFFEPPSGDNCASFGGSARRNGDPNHIFTVKACDNGEPGTDVDTFSINIDADYSKSGTLTKGNIQLHEK